MIAERSERYEAWIAPMRARAAPWRTALGLGLAGALWLAVVGLAIPLARAAGLAPERGVVVGFLLSFGVLLLGLGMVMRRLHGLPGARLLGPEERIELAPLLRGVGFVAALGGLLFLPMLGTGVLERQQPLWTWALWLPAALPAIFVQATAEEALFRGYLQGMLAARFASRLAWWLVPAAVFGALHWNPAIGENAWLMAAAAGLMGLVFGDVAARSGSLALPIGLHFANNAFAMLVVATPSPLSGLALYLSPLESDDPDAVRAALVGNMVLIGLAWGLYLVAVWWRRRRPPIA